MFLACPQILWAAGNVSTALGERSMPKNTFLDEKLRDSYNRTVMDEVLTVRGLLDEISTIDRNVAQKAEQSWIRYRPRIIINKCILQILIDLLGSSENTSN